MENVIKERWSYLSRSKPDVHRHSLLVYLNRTEKLLKYVEKIYTCKTALELYRGFNFYHYFSTTWPHIILELGEKPKGDFTSIIATSERSVASFEGVVNKSGKNIIEQEIKIPFGRYSEAPHSGFYGVCVSFVYPEKNGNMLSVYAISAEKEEPIVYYIILTESLKNE